ncbi:MAG: winged helix-turn-helix domain-containing protein [Candidatus Pacearchaeota archaeon]|jgi:DNA-binding Lrp family transcriptional regulator
MKSKFNKIRLDGIDKDILRILYSRRPLVTLKIAKYAKLSSPTVSARLSNLEKLGIVKKARINKIRKFERTFGDNLIKIKSASRIYWDLDLEDKNGGNKNE